MTDYFPTYPVDVEDNDMAMTKPARRFIAEGRLLRRGRNVPGWAGYWAFPGMIPDYVRQPDDAIREFDDEESAAIVAKLTLANALINRRTDTDKPERYQHFTPEDFAVELREAGITPTQFARLYGTTQDMVVTDWLGGLRPIPHPARVLLGLFKRHPETIAIAEAVTEKHTTPRHGFAEEGATVRQRTRAGP